MQFTSEQIDILNALSDSWLKIAQEHFKYSQFVICHVDKRLLDETFGVFKKCANELKELTNANAT